MDNDNKVTNMNDDYKLGLHEEVMLFLGDELDRIHQESTNNSYDIEAEYAKTKKNHSPLVFLVLFGVFLIISGTVFFINKYISEKNQEIEVSLEEFDDLNLNNLLNTVASIQGKYDEALKAKLVLETEYETKSNDLKEALDNELFVLNSLNLSDKREYNRRKANANENYRKGVNALKNEYEGNIILAQKQVDTYKEQLDEFDSVKISNAQEQERLLNSERQLKELEINKLKESYEARIASMDLEMKNMRSASTSEIRDAVNNVASKYQAEIATLDPKLNDIKANRIIKNAVPSSDFNGIAQLVSAQVGEEKVIESVAEYQKVYNDYKYLDDVVRSIPQKFSIPSYVEAARNLVNNMSKNYVDTSVGYYRQIVDRNMKIADRDRTIEARNKTIEERDNTIVARNKTIEERNRTIDARNKEITGLNTQIVDQRNYYEDELEKSENKFIAKSNELAATENILKNTENTLKSTETTLKNTENSLNNTKNALANVENKLEQTNAANDGALAVIFDSLGADALVLSVGSNGKMSVVVKPELRKKISYNNGVNAKLDFITAENVFIEVQDNSTVIDTAGTVPDASIVVENVFPGKDVVQVIDVNKYGLKKVIVSGRLFTEKDNFYFEINKDSDGNAVPINMSLLKSGICVNISK